MIVPPRNLSAMPRWGSTSRRRIRPSLLFSPSPIRDGDPKYLHRATIRICGQGEDASPSFREPCVRVRVPQVLSPPRGHALAQAFRWPQVPRPRRVRRLSPKNERTVALAAA